MTDTQVGQSVGQLVGQEDNQPVGREPQPLAVIFGGPSVEHTISIRSARAVIAAADPQRWRIVPLAVTRGGGWLSPSETTELLAQIESGAPEEVRTTRPLDAVQAARCIADCDAVFPLVHGAWGEDGVLQGFLETLGVPYVGPGVAASALAMNKAACKPIFEAAGIPVAPSLALPLAVWRRDPLAAQRDAASLGYPLFVKPSSGGSSIGATRVESLEELSDAFQAAFDCDHTALVESAMPEAREIECAILGNSLPHASVLGEVRTPRPFYDYVAKYEDPQTELIVPADVGPDVAERIRRYSLAAFEAVGARGMARADFLLGRGGELWLGELNTIPGFTSSSMYPRLWDACGLRFPALVTRLVELALERTGCFEAAR